MSTVEDLANDIRKVDGNHDLGAGELAEKLVELGYGKVPKVAPAAAVVKPLNSYKNGDKVQILSLNDGDWIDAFVTSVSDWGGVSVHAERGPQTIGTPDRIRLRDE